MIYCREVVVEVVAGTDILSIFCQMLSAPVLLKDKVFEKGENFSFSRWFEVE